MKDLNSTYLTKGNTNIDILLLMLEETSSILSDKLRQRISGLGLMILINSKTNQAGCAANIVELEQHLKIINIFNPDFVLQIITMLKQGLEFENKRDYSHV